LKLSLNFVPTNHIAFYFDSLAGRSTKILSRWFFRYNGVKLLAEPELVEFLE